MKFAVLVALMAIAMPAPALAADWVLVSESTNGDKYFVDRQSVRTLPDGYQRVWIQSSYLKTDPDEPNGSKYFKELDCTGGRERNLQSTNLRVGRSNRSGRACRCAPRSGACGDD